MSSYNRSKINQILARWPSGTVATSGWLRQHGIYPQLARQYEKSGWFARIGDGAYGKAHESVEWSGGLYAIQKQLCLSVHVGAKTALELRGFGHFISPRDGGPLYLFSNPTVKLPRWFTKYSWKRRVFHKMPILFRHPPQSSLTFHSFGSFEIQIATPERAILEALSLCPSLQSIEEAKLLMEGLNTLRPKLVQSLLEQCKSFKVRRLFLFLAENCNHAWLKRIDTSRIKLGKGKRSLVRDGKYIAKYKITVPHEVFEESEDKG